MSVDATSGRFLARIDPALDRLSGHVDTKPSSEARTSPDEDTAEQWDIGQVWAHLAEIVGFWVPQVRSILDARSSEGVPFGRTKADPGRVDSVERRRHEDPAFLHKELAEHVVDLKALLAGMDAEDWSRVGRHQKLGDMPMERIVDFFLVGHLEEHADQLDELAAGGAP